MSIIKSWFLAIRPKTLPAGAAPILVATAMAFGDGLHNFKTAAICLLASISVQIGTNLANDYYDHKKGTDREDRLGPTRVTQAGLISPVSVKIGFIISFLITAICCVFLFKQGGWPIVAIGIVSILSGIFYTAGRLAIGYLGLGDLFVFIFFGPVAVGATYYLQSFELNSAVLIASAAIGLLSVAILCVNNLRDMETDGKTNKKTLAVRFGKVFSHYQYMFCITTACLIPVYLFYFIEDHKMILLSTLTIFPAIPVVHLVLTSEGRALNPALGRTGQILLLFSILFSVGWIL